MTKMLPDRLPNDTPAAEVTMFELIRDAKELEPYFCLHSLGIARHRRKDYAEADLIVVGPLGVFCLEVKGGHVVRKGGTWTIGWPGGKTYESNEGPFVQSEGVRWALLDFLNKYIGPNVRNLQPDGSRMGSRGHLRSARQSRSVFGLLSQARGVLPTPSHRDWEASAAEVESSQDQRDRR